MPAVLISRSGLGPNPQRKLDLATRALAARSQKLYTNTLRNDDLEDDNEFCGWHTQTFQLRELQYDVTRSLYYQPHRHITGAELAALLERINADKLCGISVRDPVVRYHDWPLGAVIGITRDYGGYEGQEHYRRVTA